MLNIIKDKDAIWETDNYDVVLVGTSIYNMLTNGFQSKMKVKYPEIDIANKSTGYGDRRKLGKRININENPTIVLMYICGYPRKGTDSVEYECLEHCLTEINKEFKGKKVMSTIIGSSPFDGDGDKDRILGIFKKCCTDIDITLYDYEQLPRRRECAIHKGKMLTYGHIHGYDKGKELLDNVDKILHDLYLYW